MIGRRVQRWVWISRWALCGLVWWSVFSPVEAQERYLQLDAAVHAFSRYSTGHARIEILAQEAVDNGFEILVLTDADVLGVEYGLPFLRNLFAFSHDQPALLASDALGEYLEEIRRVDAAMEDLVLIDGVESRPFYYWSGIFGNGPWQLQHWNKRQIAIGLGSVGAYASLPVSGGAGGMVWHWTSFLLLWPLVGLIYAVLAHGSVIWIRGAIGLVSLLCLIDNVPFKVPLWDAYHGDLGPAPYQYYIDSVNERGGLVFWVAPDKRETVELFGGRIGAVCPPSSVESNLVHTFDYTGFAALHPGRSHHAEPGGAWDRALGQYLRRERERPVWGIGDANYQGGTPKAARTVILARERSREGVLEAMRAGRMDAAIGDERLKLEEFSIHTNRGRGGAGQNLETDGSVEVRVRIAGGSSANQPVRLRLVRSGEVVDQTTGVTPLSFTHVDADIGFGERSYYRILVNGQSEKLVSNPIFVEGKNR